MPDAAVAINVSCQLMIKKLKSREKERNVFSPMEWKCNGDVRCSGELYMWLFIEHSQDV